MVSLRGAFARRNQVVGLAKSVGHQQLPALYDQIVVDFYFKPYACVAPWVELKKSAVRVSR